MVVQPKSCPHNTEDNLEPLAVICSAHVNAVGIAISLREIGWSGRIMCLAINHGSKPPFAQQWPRLCECRSVELGTVEEFPDWLAREVTPKSVAALFFCDERLLSLSAQRPYAERFPNARFYMGPHTQLETVLDRWKFYRFLEERALAEVPLTLRADEDPWRILGKTFRIRVFRSWQGFEKLPRGFTIRCPEELQLWKDRCSREGIASEHWGYQELLDNDPKHVVSVCGWHDHDVQEYQCTRWLRQSNENAWLVETTPDPADLVSTTSNILAALDYRGPFEMEFMPDLTTGRYKAIELNPRFWLQHRILGSSLVRRYVGMENGEATGSPPFRYWLHTDVVLSCLLTLHDWDLINYIRGGVWSAPVVGSLRYVLRDIAHRVKRKLRRQSDNSDGLSSQATS